MAKNYRLEVWGAQGGKGTSGNTDVDNAANLNGRGAYVSGLVSLTNSNLLYIYVGQFGGISNSISCTWNGGGSGYHTNGRDVSLAGGGATDIRLIDGDWNNFNSLKSRIMVAAGGGGCCHGGFGGCGGNLEGGKGVTYYEANITIYNMTGGDMAGFGGTQTTGGKAGGFEWAGSAPTKGSFGIGGDGCTAYGGGGGGGYYGGGGSGVQASSMGGGGGGSSFISGHTGCNAISSTSTSTNIVHTGQPNHYSGYVFTNTVMKAGNEVMPSPTGGTETGHSGNGYCKITWHPTL